METGPRSTRSSGLRPGSPDLASPRSLLSGNLGDGTVGLRVVSDHGGITAVQDPDEALFPSMPRHAIEFGDSGPCPARH
jgi:CheB methylesterase